MPVFKCSRNIFINPVINFKFNFQNPNTHCLYNAGRDISIDGGKGEIECRDARNYFAPNSVLNTFTY